MSSAEVDEDSRSCIHLSLQRTSSSNARGTGDFYNSEVFRYGSQRYGASGSSLNNSLGRLGSLNEREQQETDDQRNVKPSATYDNPDASSATIVIDSDNPDASSAIPDTRVLLTKPRSGPFAGKQMNAAHRKSGSTWEQRVRGERGSFRGLRSPFSLHRSASEGRTQTFEIEALPNPPAVDTDNNTSLAQRTIQWLSGGNKHIRSTSAMAGSLEERHDALHQIVTE